MNRRNLGGLIAVNVVLLVTLALLGFVPEKKVYAQHVPGKGPGDYLMVSGNTQGRSEYETVYITDVKNGVILALHYNRSRKEFVNDGWRSYVLDVERSLPR